MDQRTTCGKNPSRNASELSVPYFTTNPYFCNIRGPGLSNVQQLATPMASPTSVRMCAKKQENPMSKQKWSDLNKTKQDPGVIMPSPFTERSLKFSKLGGVKRQLGNYEMIELSRVVSFREKALERIEKWIFSELGLDNLYMLDDVILEYCQPTSFNTGFSAHLVIELQNFCKNVCTAFDNHLCFFDAQDFSFWARIKESAHEQARKSITKYAESTGVLTILLLSCERLFTLYQHQNEEIVQHETMLVESIQATLREVLKRKLRACIKCFEDIEATQNKNIFLVESKKSIDKSIVLMLISEDDKTNKVLGKFTDQILFEVDKIFTELQNISNSYNNEVAENILTKFTGNFIKNINLERDNDNRNNVLRKQITAKCKCVQEFLDQGGGQLPRLVMTNIKRDLSNSQSIEETDREKLFVQKELLDKIIKTYKLEILTATSNSTDTFLCGFYNKRNRREEFMSRFDEKLSIFMEETLIQLKWEEKFKPSELENDDLLDLQTELQNLFDEVETHKFDGHFTKSYRTFEATATKLLGDLDNVDCKNNPGLRKWRNKSVCEIQDLLDHLATLVHQDGKLCNECELKGTKWE